MLEIDGATIVLEIINFLIIAVALYFLLFKPVVKRAEKQRIERERLHAELVQDRQEAARILAELNDRKAVFEDELEKIADEMYLRGKQVQDELLEAVRIQAEQIVHEEALEARYDGIMNYKSKQVEIVDTIISVSGSTLRKVLPDNVQSELIGMLVKRVWDLGRSDINQVHAIRDSLKDQEPIIRIDTAEEMSIEDKGSLVRTFNALADKDVVLELGLDPTLISGIKVHIGDIILENSIQKHLSGIRKDVVRSVERMFEDETDEG